MILRILLLVSALYLTATSTTTTVSTTESTTPVIDDDYIASLHPDRRPWRVNLILEIPGDQYPPPEETVANAYLEGLHEHKSDHLAIMSTSLKTNTSSDTVKFYKLDGRMLHKMLSTFRDARSKNLNDTAFDRQATRARIDVAKFVPNVVNLTVRIELFPLESATENHASWKGRADGEMKKRFRQYPELGVQISFSNITQLGAEGIQAEFYDIICDVLTAGQGRLLNDTTLISQSVEFRLHAFSITDKLRAACKCKNWTTLTECHYKMDESKDQCLETAERLMNKRHLCSQQLLCTEWPQVRRIGTSWLDFDFKNVGKYCDKENVTRAPCNNTASGATPCRIACENAPNSTGECNATCEEPDGYRSIDKIFEGRLKCCGLIMTEYPIFEKCKITESECTTGAVKPTDIGETDEPEPTVEETIGVNVTRTTTSASGNASKEEGMSDETVIALGAGCLGGAIVAFTVLGLIVYFTYIRPRRVRKVERKIEMEKTIQIRRKARTMRLKAASMRSKATGGKSAVDPKVQATKTVVDPKKAVDLKKKATPVGKK